MASIKLVKIARDRASNSRRNIGRKYGTHPWKLVRNRLKAYLQEVEEEDNYSQ
jgi:hypothetical protein